MKWNISTSTLVFDCRTIFYHFSTLTWHVISLTCCNWVHSFYYSANTTMNSHTLLWKNENGTASALLMLRGTWIDCRTISIHFATLPRHNTHLTNCNSVHMCVFWPRVSSTFPTIALKRSLKSQCIKHSLIHRELTMQNISWWMIGLPVIDGSYYQSLCCSFRYKLG